MAVPFLVELGLYVYCREASLLYEQLIRIVPFLYGSSSMPLLHSRSPALLFKPSSILADLLLA
ncbi:hypothetical protein [Prochlorococcus marinus]|uniref:hypothetical protein n=1 Tax=Prochlorococcus marinus TaxID=1219 RepID=UPI000AABF91C|nr:hypothetical protein [Prochlorococcus marinus]